MKTGTLWLSCGVLQAELKTLHQRGQIQGTLQFLDSMLHMIPPRLEETLTALLEENSRRPDVLVLVYGDCCSRMLDLVRRFQVGRTHAINCAQMLVGPVRYRQLMHEGAFLVLPEWAERWEQIMQHELRLTQPVAHEFMRDQLSTLVYLDTGLVPVPRQQMEAFSAYSGLPWRVEPVGLDSLRGLLLAAEAEIQSLRGLASAP